MNDDAHARHVTDWLGKVIWTVSVSRLVQDPATTAEMIVMALMLELGREPGFLIDSEAFERYVRRLLDTWWPAMRRQSAAIRVSRR